MELEVIMELLPLELALKITPLVREVIEELQHSLGAELEFDIFLVLDGCEVHFVMEPVSVATRRGKGAIGSLVKSSRCLAQKAIYSGRSLSGSGRDRMPRKSSGISNGANSSRFQTSEPIRFISC